MNTKDASIVVSMALRSSRRFKGNNSKEAEKLQDKNLVKQIHAKQPNNFIVDHNREQNGFRKQQHRTSPYNNDHLAVIIPQDNSRRMTRSSLLSSKKIYGSADLQNEPTTPDNNQISKATQEPTCKKTITAISLQAFSENVCPDLNESVKKLIAKLPQNIQPPFNEVRKSYRRKHSSQIVNVPYRKCHDAFQARIISIMNKIEDRKNCFRDFESLVERIQKISGREMMNKYIISGISTIVRLSKEKDIYDIKLIERLQSEARKLKQKILEEMDTVDAYELCLPDKNQKVIDSKGYKNKLIRKIYKIMKYKSNNRLGGKSEMREKAIKDCQQLFCRNIEPRNIIKFFKQAAEFLKQ